LHASDDDKDIAERPLYFSYVLILSIGLDLIGVKMKLLFNNNPTKKIIKLKYLFENRRAF